MTDKIIPEYSSNQIDIPKFNFGELVQKVEIPEWKGTSTKYINMNMQGEEPHEVLNFE